MKQAAGLQAAGAPAARRRRVAPERGGRGARGLGQADEGGGRAVGKQREARVQMQGMIVRRGFL